MIIDLEKSPFDSRVAIFIYQLALYELPAKKIGDLVRSLTEDRALQFVDPYHAGYANEVAGVLLDEIQTVPTLLEVEEEEEDDA